MATGKRRREMDFSGVEVLTIGDVMLDYYITGVATRVSPEAPVPVVSKRSSWSVPGGAANVARGLARLGCTSRLVGLIGADAPGETLRQQTLAEGIRAGLVKSSSRPTTCKTRILAHGQQLLRVDEETIQKPDLEEKVALRVNLEDQIRDCQALIISDYAKGVLLPGRDGTSMASIALEMAKARAIPVLVDPKGTDWSRYRGATCVTPNTAEFIKVCEAQGLWSGEGEPGSAERKHLAEELCRKFDLGLLLLTRGARGMTLYQPGRAPENIRAVMREVADVSGAGDTVIATLAACAAKGESWEEAARIANAAAGIAVTKLGATPVSISELNQALEEKGANPKLFTVRELEERIAQWRRQGQRIVFTNGCFDLLHPGHISLLKQSAALGDRLIVGLNSDASVRRLKGPERPIQDEKSRALLLTALQSVDAVVLFGEDTPEQLIHAVRPDVLVKGSDYRIKDVAGADFVQSYGGHVQLINLVEGFSTTDLARRIKARQSCQ